LGEFEITLKLERGMLADGMMRSEEHAKTETLGHKFSHSFVWKPLRNFGEHIRAESES
jgi:hypothetical protein